MNKRTFHRSSHCPADKSAKKIDTKGNACHSCFITFSHDLPDRGKMEDHMFNNCRHQKRVKRVMLYGIENVQDPGNSARRLLVSTLSNPVHWFSVMARNIIAINQRKK